MDTTMDQKEWEALSHEEKNHQLYLKQKAILKAFLERRAISKEQYEIDLYLLLIS